MSDETAAQFEAQRPRLRAIATRILGSTTDADDAVQETAAQFEAQRPRLRAIATRILGSTTDADDAVQETWLRLARAESDVTAPPIDNLDAWLTTVVSRLCLDQLKSARSRHEGWRIEPWAETAAEPAGQTSSIADPAAAAEQHDDVAVALLVVLESLTPDERVAFVLHDVFGRPFAEIASTLGVSGDAARQLASRGRRRARGTAAIGARDRRRERDLVGAWLRAVESGDLGTLLGMLAPDAVLHADYGSAQQVLEGRDAIAEGAVAASRLAAHSVPVLIDGRPGVAAILHDAVVSVMAFTWLDDAIVALDVLADPRRLEGVAQRIAR